MSTTRLRKLPWTVTILNSKEAVSKHWKFSDSEIRAAIENVLERRNTNGG